MNYNKPMAASATFSSWWLCLYCRPKTGFSAWQTLPFFTAPPSCLIKSHDLWFHLFCGSSWIPLTSHPWKRKGWKTEPADCAWNTL